MSNIAMKTMVAPPNTGLVTRRDELAGSVGSGTLERAPFRWTERDKDTLPVQVDGQLPAWLKGDLVRTAPAVFDAQLARGRWQAEHWFDGLGLMFGFSIDGSTPGVQYRQRLLDSKVARELGQGRAATSSFGTDMQRSLWLRLRQPIPHVTDNTNVNVVPWQGHWLAMTETMHQHVLDRHDLGSRGLYRYDDRLPRSMAMSAHPHFDFEQKALVNVGNTFGPRNELWVYRQQEDTHTRVLEGKLAFKHLPYVHDFGLSRRHVVIVDHPLSLSPLRLLFSNHGLMHAFRWDARRATRLWKLERATGKWSEYQTEPLFCFHTVNTFEDGEDVVLDFLAYEDASIVERLRTARLADEGPPVITGRFLRARMSPGRRHVELELLSKQRFDFPNIAYRTQHGARYETAWGSSLVNAATQAEVDTVGWRPEVVRVDLRDGSVKSFSEPDMSYGEPVFVPRPGASRPDDGVILSLGSHAQEDRSALVVLDATDLTPLAHCRVPLSLPFGFHGTFQAR